MITIGSAWTCNKRQVVAEEHYKERIEKIDVKMKEI